MDLVQACLLFLFLCSANTYQFKGGPRFSSFMQDPELEWAKMETIIGEEKTQAPAPGIKFLRSSSSYGSSTREVKKVPEYVIVPASKVQKELFKPEKGTRPLPNSIKQTLLGSYTTDRAKPKASKPFINILCHVDRMYVRIKREVFNTNDAYKDLKLGTCPVNAGDKTYFFLLYKLDSKCGFKKESNQDERSISITFTYNPSSPVVRDLPFSVSLQCKFPRFFNSFKAAIYPKLQGGTVFKALQPKSDYTLTPQDASGNEITGAKNYILGQPMYFEAKQSSSTSKLDQRIYITKCFMTASKDPNSNLKYAAIDNHGCMVDGKLSEQSKFLTGDSKMVQKFSIGALVFKDSVSSTTASQQLYMHCEIAVGKATPTPSLKACNYDRKSKTWKELYGDDSVCTCCKSSCSSNPKASRKLISSHSWKVDLSREDEDLDFEPQMKTGDVGMFNLEDPDMADFLSHWDHDY